MKPILARSVVLALSMLASIAYAKEEKSLVIGCEGAPKAAIVTLPAQAAKWASLQCTIYGHMITSARDWMWVYPGNPAPVIFPAQMVMRNPQEVGHKSYFKSVRFLRLDNKEAARQFSIFSKNFQHVGKDVPKVYKLIAVNEKGVSQKIFFFDGGKGNLWAYGCTPDCRPDAPFQVRDMRKP